jgi:hypothetical protein
MTPTRHTITTKLSVSRRPFGETGSEAQAA